MRILFLVPYPVSKAPSQRFRFEQYFGLLERNGIQYDVSSFLDEKTWDIIYKPGRIPLKISGILKGYFMRFLSLFYVWKYDYVFVHREIVPFGPPIVGWILSRIFGKKIIYDFDDAIWIPNASEHNKLMFYFKRYSNARAFCKMAYKVSCGNKYLQNFAMQYTENAVYNPTTIDTETYHNAIKNQDTGKFVIGWTGSHSTIQYLNDLVPVFEELEKKYNFELHVISDSKPKFELKSLVFVPWNKDTEIEDLMKFNIGLMPLSSDKWAEGKCGFKALQYMALGIPALVSPVGVNTSIVDDGINGFFCGNAEEWISKISSLLEDRKLLKTMGQNTRDKIVRYYSVKSNNENFLQLFS